MNIGMYGTSRYRMPGKPISRLHRVSLCRPSSSVTQAAPVGNGGASTDHPVIQVGHLPSLVLDAQYADTYHCCLASMCPYHNLERHTYCITSADGTLFSLI